MSREEAAAKAYWGDKEPDDLSVMEMVTARLRADRALAAADAHDATHGIHRVTLDDATVERAARAINSQFTLQWEKLPEWVREDERRIVRAVLAAAVEAGQ